MGFSESLNILYEDNHVMVVLKAAGVSVQGDTTSALSLLERVRLDLIKRYSKKGNAFVGLVHRLDKPVSGVIAFAKTSKGASRLSEQVRNREIRKVYQAIVEGRLGGAERKLAHFHKADAEGGPVSVTEEEVPGSKRAELILRPLRTGSHRSLVEVELLTGRKHQIRAQLACLGHPILGDSKYGSRTAFEPGAIALHAVSLEFRNPVKPDESIRVLSPFPPEQTWQAWL
jgi:23S rRNA pseudouridine1911/1915/1917 synthase